MRPLAAALALGLPSLGCVLGDPVDSHAGGRTLALSFRADAVATGNEDYLCFGFERPDIAGLALQRIDWSPPVGGGVSLHHATLFALPNPLPDGPFSCRFMPTDAVGLHIWAPGDEPLALPEGYALAIPAGTTQLLVQAHVLRALDGPAAPATVTLSVSDEAPAHLAAWHSTIAAVPPIPAHGQAVASSRCLGRADVHTLFVWPHMHRLGRSFHGTVVSPDGERCPLVDVESWDVARERTYPAAVDIRAGDVIETSCQWENGGDDVVLGGPLTSDEMCTQGLVWWPADAPRCEPL